MESGSRRTVLNVGGGSDAIAIPKHYDHWERRRLDIDPACEPDILLDARELASLEPRLFDAVYSSHNLEHFHAHEARIVVEGIRHILKDDGFAEIRVPDLGAVFRQMVRNDMDIDDVLYTSPAGPITIKDVIYGYGRQIERSGVDYYAHKTGFTAKSLFRLLRAGGFPISYSDVGKNYEIRVLAFTSPPIPEYAALLGLSDHPSEKPGGPDASRAKRAFKTYQV